MKDISFETGVYTFGPQEELGNLLTEVAKFVDSQTDYPLALIHTWDDDGWSATLVMKHQPL